jgi:hypothetical protein
MTQREFKRLKKLADIEGWLIDCKVRRKAVIMKAREESRYDEGGGFNAMSHLH